MFVIVVIVIMAHPQCSAEGRLSVATQRPASTAVPPRVIHQCQVPQEPSSGIKFAEKRDLPSQMRESPYDVRYDMDSFSHQIS